MLGKGVAAAAMTHRGQRILQRRGQFCGSVAVMLKQVIGHALSRLLPHTGQAPQSVDQSIEAGFGHPGAPKP